MGVRLNRLRRLLELRDDLALFGEQLGVLSHTVSVGSQDLAAHLEEFVLGISRVRVVSRDVLALPRLPFLRTAVDLSSVLLGHACSRAGELGDARASSSGHTLHLSEFRLLLSLPLLDVLEWLPRVALVLLHRLLHIVKEEVPLVFIDQVLVSHHLVLEPTRAVVAVHIHIV